MLTPTMSFRPPHHPRQFYPTTTTNSIGGSRWCSQCPHFPDGSEATVEEAQSGFQSRTAQKEAVAWCVCNTRQMQKQQRVFFLALVLLLVALFLLLLSRSDEVRRVAAAAAAARGGGGGGSATQGGVWGDSGSDKETPEGMYEAWRRREQQRRRGAVRVLFVTDRQRNYDAGMSRHFFWVYNAMLVHPRVAEAVLWGPGFAGYDARRSLRENVVGRFGSVGHFDMVLVYGAFDGGAVRALSAETVVALREHECWDDICWPRVEGYNASLVFMTYAQDLGAFRNRSAHRLFVNTPHGAKLEYFRADSFSNRSISVLIVGKVDPIVYPLRVCFLLPSSHTHPTLTVFIKKNVCF